MLFAHTLNNKVMTQQNSYFIDVDVTDKSDEEKRKIKSEYMGRLGFKNFASGWDKNRMFYTFWYVGDQTLAIVEQLSTEEIDTITKAKSMSCLPEPEQGSETPKPKLESSTQILHRILKEQSSVFEGLSGKKKHNPEATLQKIVAEDSNSLEALSGIHNQKSKTKQV